MPDSLKILVVEEDPEAIIEIRDALVRSGYRLAGSARTGEEAAERAAELKPDLVLMDIAPAGGMDGIETAVRILAKTDVPIIYLAGREDGESLERAKITGLFGFLLKPLDPLQVRLSIELAMQRHQTEKRLKESGQRCKKLLSSVTNYIYTVSIEGGRAVATSHGPGCAEVTGYTSGEFAADPFLWQRIIHEEDRQGVLDQAAGLLSGGPAGLLEHRIIHRDGTLRWVRNTLVPSYDERGRLVSYDGLVTDITEKKQLEEQIRQAYKMDALRQFADGVAHDFNNFLQAIIGYGSILDMQMSAGDPQRKNVELILASAENAANMTRNLRAFSGKQVAAQKRLNLNEVIRGAGELLRGLAGPDIRLEIDTCDEDLAVMADAGQLERVLRDLVANAKEAMPAGGRLQISTRKCSPEKESAVTGEGPRPSGPYAALAVADAGAGLDDAARRHIFEPSFAAGRPRGFGLSIAHEIVRQHGGFMEAESRAGGGSVFTVYLPLPEAEPSAVLPAEPVPLGKGSETILLAEDDAISRRLTRTVMEELGYKVIEAVDGEDAVEKFRKHGGKVSLLVLDVILPKMNGKDVYDAISALQPGIKVLFMSGYTASIIYRKGILEQGLNFIPKPVSPRVVMKRIREILDA